MPGDERKGFDRGILYILIAVVYLALAWVIIDSLDWNPHTPNYAQYLVGASGAYVDGGVYGDRYFFVVADSGDANSAALVFTDPSGEVLDAYRLSPRPSVVMNTKDALFFLFVEGNRLQILAYRGGRFLHTFAASTTWSLQPIYPTRVVDDPYGLAFARKDDIDAQGIIFVSIEDNVLDPLLRVYFCRGCEFTPLYALPNGELVASVRKAVTIFIPAQNGVRTIEVRSTPAILPTDVCGDVLVGVSEDRHLVWSKLESDRLYDANIPVESFPICRDDEIYFSSDGVLSAVTISPELNEVISFFSSASPFVPYAVFDDLPYFVLAGEDSGNPAFLRNYVSGLKCPDTLYRVDKNVDVEMLPITYSDASEIRWSTPTTAPAEGFVSVERVTVDEDFRCYRP